MKRLGLRPFKCINYIHNLNLQLPWSTSEQCFIIDATSLKVKWKGKECKATVTHVKFGPSSIIFALIDKTNKIYVYDNKDRCKSFKPRLKIVTDFHKAPITSIDFSKDSYYIQTSSADYEHIRCKL